MNVPNSRSTNLPQLTLEIDDRSIEQLRCSCGAWAALSLESREVIRNGVTIRGPMPTLQCTSCDTVRIPYRMKIALHELAEEAGRRGTPQVRINVPAAAAAKQKFPYCKGVPLTYEALDWLYIPGLSHGGAGFLTPVFFARDILTYFYNHPDYAVSFGSDTYGTLYTKEGYISFGINGNGKLIMWLGDLDELSSRDQLLLAAHNVPSDHAIGCEFYEGQIEAVFTELSQEQRLIRVSGKFATALIGYRHVLLRGRQRPKRSSRLWARLPASSSLCRETEMSSASSSASTRAVSPAASESTERHGLGYPCLGGHE